VAFPLFLTRLVIRSGLARWLPGACPPDTDAAALRYLSDRMLTGPHAQLATAAAFFELHEPNGIDLALGAPRFDLVPAAARPAVDLRAYPPPWGLPELREIIAAHVLARHRQALSPVDEVLVTHGAAGALSVALDAFVSRGDRVVLFDPTSPFFPLAALHRGARLRWVPTQTENGRLLFRLDHLAEALRGAKMLLLANPANPTGATIAPEDLEQIEWWARHQDVLLFNDEVFARYCYEGKPSSLNDLPGARPRTLTAAGVSKSHSLAGARVGWLTGPRALLKACAAAQTLQAPFVPAVCQQLTLAALRQDEAAFEPIRAAFAARRRYGFDRLTALGLKPGWPAGAFFFWVPVRQLGLDGRAFAEQLLRAHKVLVTPGELFGPSGAGHVRVSFAAEDGRLREGLTRLAEFVRRPVSAVPQAA
jgi:aspartate/methionine/tyrosine aminotransferase